MTGATGSVSNLFGEHLAQLHKAMEEGIPVLGYCHWSLMTT
jgi:beta-glucosidase/6-phospho-beta-glucosidase/beta-galactosidase